MEKMKALSWDKLRRLVGKRKKDKDKKDSCGGATALDSSRFQRSYSFKRGSIRKSGRRVISSTPVKTPQEAPFQEVTVNVDVISRGGGGKVNGHTKSELEALHAELNRGGG